ncbi:S66 peptidase family protein [Kurthia gibsonii]|uniref:S66 peptidase family protein n=1 Tax=Kurthia gibsonii TaxID=33946 RepID=UPI001141AE8F|nr:LD-carboxypeptidase [Kurthia gibsonii]GED18638.1 putative murein peptide carboxypeptidase [Kurthia gibsonii]
MKQRPMRLQKGDTVGIVAPASPPNQQQLKKSLDFIEGLGLQYVMGESVTAKEHYLAGSDELRVRDLQRMVEDPSIRAIFCASGGYGSARIADQLDYMLFEENPKIFWGFSDITFLHTAIGELSNLVTFHGPTLSSLGREDIPERTYLMFEQLFNPAEIYYDERISPLQTIAKGRVRAPIVGGNLTLLCESLGTKFEVDTANKVLLIEDIGLEPAQIDAKLNQLRMARKFEHCAGVVIGSFTHAEPRDYKDSPSLDALFTSYFKDFNKPVVSGFKFGHENLNVGIPLGVDVILDADEKVLAFLPGVE